MTREEIQKEFDSFFEFPGKGRDYVTSVSCRLFAERIAEMERTKHMECIVRRGLTMEKQMDADSDLRAKLKSLVDELKSDLNRPEGRWGMHGHSAVDDDYFAALEYAIKKLDALLSDTPNAH